MVLQCLSLRVSAQRVSLDQVICAGRAGDKLSAAAPSDAEKVADLVLLHTDVEMNRLLTDVSDNLVVSDADEYSKFFKGIQCLYSLSLDVQESVALYEESVSLYQLWQLVQRHRLEDAAPSKSRVRAQRWTRAHSDYLNRYP